MINTNQSINLRKDDGTTLGLIQVLTLHQLNYSLCESLHSSLQYYPKKNINITSLLICNKVAKLINLTHIRDLERLIICSEADSRNILQPNRESSAHCPKTTTLELRNRQISWTYKGQLLPEVPLSTNVRPNPKMSIETSFVNRLHESHQIISPFKIILNRKTEPSTNERT